MMQIVIDGFAQAQRSPQGVIVPPLPPALRKRHSVRMYSPAEVRKWQAEARYLAAQAMKDLTPLKGQLLVDIRVFLAPPASMPKKKLALALAGLIHPTTRPDCDNYAKSTLDALNGICWLDDAQIVHLTVSKHYSEKPRVEIDISERAYPSGVAMPATTGTLFNQAKDP
jgi:Holliday junction resolvase RusA-like endonuclease